MFTNVTNFVTFVIVFAFTFVILIYLVVTFSSLNYSEIKEFTVEGRYITFTQFQNFFRKEANRQIVSPIGKSVQKKVINKITLGSGKIKILMWSQMHGNETTTTKALFDLINYLQTNADLANYILSSVTLTIVPLLNPDGAVLFTRENANKIDLNRDALELSQPESRVLRDLYDEIEPDYCFNLHDQRTIFNVGNTEKPATLSFLAPAHDDQRNISVSRGRSMKIIGGINKALTSIIPNQMGRYDDAFNPNCVGDTFQMLGTPTILFEAGHFPLDYERERTRELMFYAIFKAISIIAESQIEEHSLDSYFEIPENNKQFFDVLISNAHLINSKYEHRLGILYKEVLNNETLLFKPFIEATGELKESFGHKYLNCENQDDLDFLKDNPKFLQLLF
ncbi:M14 metallopeptidase family protein [uncultured Eudoraea sp.]|uniref:M14 family metallopeptidase n=1 Tax=uncultured Eudoraea sp. TaxID=1035614 RepID=UPI00262D7CF2|nr:M14 metallopeptidase family protein [uncultured Eudoraea sp.]